MSERCTEHEGNFEWLCNEENLTKGDCPYCLIEKLEKRLGDIQFAIQGLKEELKDFEPINWSVKEKIIDKWLSIE